MCTEFRSHLNPLATEHQIMNSGGNPSQVGSEAHYAAYEAEYQMRSQMESMQADIQEVCPNVG